MYLLAFKQHLLAHLALTQGDQNKKNGYKKTHSKIQS